MTVDSIRTMDQNALVYTMRGNYPSFTGRTQYHQFHFTRERDAHMFARDFNPSTQPGKDFIKGTFVVAL